MEVTMNKYFSGLLLLSTVAMAKTPLTTDRFESGVFTESVSRAEEVSGGPLAACADLAASYLVDAEKKSIKIGSFACTEGASNSGFSLKLYAPKASATAETYAKGPSTNAPAPYSPRRTDPQFKNGKKVQRDHMPLLDEVQ
jgi:hypothetical protein